MYRYLRDVKILFIGDLNLNRAPQGGGQFKARVLDSIYRKSANILYQRIDTNGYKSNWSILIKIFIGLFIKKWHIIIVATATKSADRLFSIIELLSPKLLNKIIYHPQGMFIEQAIIKGVYNNKKYKKIRIVYIESPRAVAIFKDIGIKAAYFPNVKTFNLEKTYVRYKNPNVKIWNLVFVSQIAEEKGVFLILEALKRLEIEHPEFQIRMDFFGPFDEAIKRDFFSIISKMKYVNYCGFLDLLNSSDSSYDVLSTYDFMILPTFWQGEGIAGAFIDAFIAGLPVLTTSWNINEEIIRDGFNGWIIPIRNVDEIVLKILSITENIDRLNVMKQNSFDSRFAHHIDFVADNLLKDVQTS